MDELIALIVSKTGISEDVAKQATSIILSFLNKEGPAEQVQQIVGELPGAAEMIAAGETEKSGGGLLGGLASMVPGGGAMQTLSQLTGAGLEMGQIKPVAGTIIDYARQKAGDDVVNQVISQIPALKQVL